MRVIFLLFTWFAVSLTLSLAGVLASVRSATLLALGLFLPVTLFGALFEGSPVFRAWLAALPLRVLTLGQFPRVLGGSFLLWEFSQGALPAAFALPTGISDVVVALSAIPAALFLVSSSGRPGRAFLAWHIFGLACLVISSASGIITSPQALSVFPMSLVPVFFGPVMILLHFAAIAAARTYS